MTRGDEAKTVKRRRRGKRKDDGQALTSLLRLPLDLSSARERSMESSDVLVGILRPILGHPRQEVMVAVALDSRQRILGVLIVSLGTLSACIAHPREIFRDAIKRSAATIILVHSHPSGDPEPSEEDHVLTRRIKAAGEVLGIPVLDHIVMGQDTHWSYADNDQCLFTEGLRWMRP